MSYVNPNTYKDAIMINTEGVMTITISQDTCGTGYLECFQICDLFCYIVNKYFPEKTNINNIVVTQNPAGTFLHRVNFRYRLCKIFDINCEESTRTGKSEKLLEMHLFRGQEEFEAHINKIREITLNAGIKDATQVSMLCNSCLPELCTNTFEHNSGKRGETGPYIGILLHDNSFANKLNCTVFDFGVGFSGTLSKKFPGPMTEAEYIELAFKDGISCREAGNTANKGGFGLTFLQNFVLDRCDGIIIVRSRQTYARIKEKEKIDNLRSSNYTMNGIAIGFSIKKP